MKIYTMHHVDLPWHPGMRLFRRRGESLSTEDVRLCPCSARTPCHQVEARTRGKSRIYTPIEREAHEHHVADQPGACRAGNSCCATERPSRNLAYARLAPRRAFRSWYPSPLCNARDTRPFARPRSTEPPKPSAHNLPQSYHRHLPTSPHYTLHPLLISPTYSPSSSRTPPFPRSATPCTPSRHPARFVLLVSPLYTHTSEFALSFSCSRIPSFFLALILPL